MARNPCSNCRQTGGSRLRYWYLMGWEGERSLKYRLRLCAACQEGLLMDLISVGDVQDPAGRWISPEEAI
jgi:hypothetical protein